MDESVRLGLPYLIPNQAQKHVTVNEAFRRLDQIVQLCVRSRITLVQPAAPSEGDAYVIPAGATGELWSGYAINAIAAFQDGAWTAFAAAEGTNAYVVDEAAMIVFDGAGWVLLAAGIPGDETDQFGINTSADLTNRLSVKSDAVLFHYDDVTPGDGNCRIVVDKSATAATASMVFQSESSGRGEIGLTGNDDFHLRVSHDGATWIDAVTIDKDTGYVGVGTDTPAAPFHVNAGLANVAFKLEGTDPTIVFQMQDDTTTATGNGPILFLRTGDSTQFYTAGSARMTIDPSGKVGIGLSSPAARLHVFGGGIVAGSPAGGDKGAGTVNAEAVYDDNTLLSCYVLDQAIDGHVDLAKWDAKVPDRHAPAQREFDPFGTIDPADIPADILVRRHAPARWFTARIGSAHDPLTLDGYARHWKEKRHLSSMPNEAAFDSVHGQLTTGEWIQRLVETVEIHAVLIDALNEALKQNMAAAPPPR